MAVGRPVQGLNRVPIAKTSSFPFLHVTVCCDPALQALRVDVAATLVVLRGKSTSCHVKPSLSIPGGVACLLPKTIPAGASKPFDFDK
jgi:hypothetical protein